MACNHCGAAYPIPHEADCPRAPPPGVTAYCLCGGTGVRRAPDTERYVPCTCGRRPSSVGAKKLALQRRLDERLAELHREERDRMEESKRAEAEKGACGVCGTLVNPDGSPVTWRCAGCGGRVCRGHTLTVPGKVPEEYYTDTLCSHACWEKVGRPQD